MFRFDVSNHRTNHAEPMLDRSSCSSALAIVNLNWNLDDSQPVPIGFPEDFGACAHVCLHWVDGSNRGTRIGSEAALGIPHFSAVVRSQISELGNDTNAESAVPWHCARCLRVQKSGANAHVGLALGHRSNHHRYLLRPMLAIPVKDHKDVGSAVPGVSEATSHRRSVPLVHVVRYNLSPCQRRGVRCIV